MAMESIGMLSSVLEMSSSKEDVVDSEDTVCSDGIESVDELLEVLLLQYPGMVEVPRRSGTFDGERNNKATSLSSCCSSLSALSNERDGL